MNPSASSSQQVMDNASARNIRNNSTLLSTFPWATDFLVQDLTSIVKFEEFSTYINAINQVETNIRTAGANDVDASQMEFILGRVKPEADGFLPVRLKRPYVTRMCETVCAYKLIDVLYDLQDNDGPTSNRPVHTKLRIGKYLPSQFWPLEDWVGLLESAKGLLDTLKAFHPVMDITTQTMTTTTTTTTTPTAPLTFKLLRGLMALSKNQDALNLLQNVQIAALHIAWMMRGNEGQESRMAVPNMRPEGLNLDTNANLTEEERLFLQDFIRTSEINRIRHPLYGALLYSPLYLLTHRKLTSNAWDQERMVKLSKALGNEKPPMLVTAERLLWKAILDIATGKQECYIALKGFLTAVDWDAIAMVSEGDRAHFANDDKSPEVNCDLSSYHGEKMLPEFWPLAQYRQVQASASTSNVQSSPAPPTTDDMAVDAPPSTEAPADHPSAQMDPAASDASQDDEPSSTLQAFRSDRLRERHESGRITNIPNEAVSESPRRRRPRKTGRDTVQRTSGTTRFQYKFIPYQQIAKGIFVQQVQIKTPKKINITFDGKAERTRVRGEEVTLLDVAGEPIKWTPEFHFKDDLKNFGKFHDLVMKNLLNGKPRYVSGTSASHIKTIKYEDYKRKSPQVIQSVLRDQHLVIMDYPVELVVPTDNVEFDEAGLQLLKNLEAPIEFQDQSIKVHDDYSVQICTGTLEHLLANANKKGPIINALSFPLPLSEIRKTAFSSDVEAWMVTEGLPYCDHDTSYPTSEMRWGLAATEGARHWIHVDCDGLGTFVDVVCGAKWWLLFTPAAEFDLENFGDLDHFSYGFDVTNPPDHWDVEAVYLQPGMRLLMKPNTPHAVFTTKDTITLGGHFFLFGSIQQTFFGIVHAFVMDTLVTNTEHPKTRVLLLRMLQYLYKFYVEGSDPKKNVARHLPELGNDFKTAVDVLTLCNYCILSNLLDPRTYNFPGLPYGEKATAEQLSQRKRHDYNVLSPDDRCHFSYVRGLSINLIHWIDSQFVFRDDNGAPRNFVAIARSYLHQQVRGIVAYKLKAEKKSIRGVPNCTAADIRRQAGLLFSERLPEFGGLSFEDKDMDVDTFSFEGKFTQEKRSKPLEFVERDPLKLGTTKGDAVFSTGSTLGFPMTDEFGMTEDEIRPVPATLTTNLQENPSPAAPRSAMAEEAEVENEIAAGNSGPSSDDIMADVDVTEPVDFSGDVDVDEDENDDEADGEDEDYDDDNNKVREDSDNTDEIILNSDIVRSYDDSYQYDDAGYDSAFEYDDWEDKMQKRVHMRLRSP